MEEYKNKGSATQLKIKFVFSILTLIFFSAYLNILRPLCIFSNLIFCFTSNFDYLESLEGEAEFSNLIVLIGMILIFVIPLIPLLINLFRVLALAKGKLQKFLYFIYLLLECIFEIPLPVFYSSTGHSIFLLNQTGVGEIINPWFIFFPTNHVLSWISIIRNFLISCYFIFISAVLAVINQALSNHGVTDISSSSMGFQTTFYLILIILNVFNLIGLIAILIFKCVFADENKKENEKVDEGSRIEKIKDKKEKEMNNSSINKVENEKEFKNE